MVTEKGVNSDLNVLLSNGGGESVKDKGKMLKGDGRR